MNKFMQSIIESDMTKEPNDEIKDAYGIFTPVRKVQFVKRYIDAADERLLRRDFVHPQFGAGYYRYCPDAEEYVYPKYAKVNVEKFDKYITRHTGVLYIQMLIEMEKSPCSYHEIYERVLKPRGISFGNDTLLFKSLMVNGLAEIDQVGKYRRKFYRPTALGKVVIETAKKNDVAFKVLRHVMKFKDDCDNIQLVNASLNLENFDDFSTSAYVSLLEALMDDNSPLHEVGSHAYWCNKLIQGLKKSDFFFSMFNCPEVQAWLEEHKTWSNVQRFMKTWNKICKKYSKAA